MERIKPLIIRVVAIIVSIAVVVGLSLGTIQLLRSVAPRDDVDGVTGQAVALTASQAVEAYARAETIQDLSTYKKQQSADTKTTVMVQLDGQDYSVAVPTVQYVTYLSKEKRDTDDTKSIRDQTTVFMNSSGYKETKHQKVSDAIGPFYATYESSDAVCQLLSSGIANKNEQPYHTLSCIEKKMLNDEYAVIEKLLKVYETTNKVPTFNEVVRSSVSEGEKSLTIASFMQGEKKTKLLFATVKNNDDPLKSDWDYIGDLSATKETSTKFTVSSKLQAALEDPKYGDFLTRYINNGN